MIMNNRSGPIFSHIASALAAALILVSAAVVAVRTEIGYDEGYHLQIPLSLVTHGQYASTRDGGGVFDPYVSPGPTVMLPAAASFSLFGTGLVQARVVMLIYFAAFLALVWLVSKRLFGGIVAPLAIVVAACAPSAFVHGATVLGEVPALAFLMGAVLALSQRRFRMAGMLLGLAALTKFVFFLALVPVALLAAIEMASVPHGLRSRAGKPYLVTGALAFVPAILWEAVQLGVLGLPAYFENKYLFVSFLMGNSGAGQLAQGASHLAARMATLNESFGRQGLLVLAAAAAAVGLGVAEQRARRERDSDRAARSAATFLLFYVITHMVWWLLSPNMGFWRYAFPGYAAAAPFVAGAFVWFAHTRQPAAILAASVGAALLAACLIARPGIREYRYVASASSGNKLAVQRATAAYVRAHSRLGALFACWGWWQAPEIQFLAREGFYDITRGTSRRFLNREAAAGRRTMVIVSPYQDSFTPPPGNWVYIRKYCGDVKRRIGGGDGWTIWEYIPDSDTVEQYRAARDRGDFTQMKPWVEPPSGKAAAGQIQSGFYGDGWMERRAGAWLRLPARARSIKIAGVADLEPFENAPLKLSVSVMGGPRTPHIISSSGEFVLDVKLEPGMRAYEAVNVTLFSDRWYVPRNLEKKPEARSGLKGWLRSHLRDRMGLRIPDRRELSVRILRLEAR